MDYKVGNKMNVEIQAPRSLKSQKTKEQIFQTAIKLMKKYGYEYLTVRNICAASGISTGTFYHYFNGKDDLLSYYIADGFNNYLKNRDEAALSALGLKEKVIHLYSWYIQYCQETGLDFLSYYYTPQNKSLHTRGNTGMGISYSAVTHHVLLAIKEAQETGELSQEYDASTIGDDICVIVKGSIFDWCISNGSYELQPYVSRMIDIYLHYYGL